jgi:hypothetical protein
LTDNLGLSTERFNTVAPGACRFYSANRDRNISKHDAFKTIDFSYLDNLIEIVDNEISSSSIKQDIFCEMKTSYISDDYYNNENTQLKEYISVFSKSGDLLANLPLQEYHGEVIKHNASLIMPGLDEYKLEKEAYLE